MFATLKSTLADKFPEGTHQLRLLYTEVLDHFGMSGLEAEEAADLVMMQLEYECFLQVRRYNMPDRPDVFEMIRPSNEENDGRDYRWTEDW